MRRRPAQLVHALGGYYRDLGRGAPAPRLGSERLDRLAAHAGCWLLDRLLRRGR